MYMNIRGQAENQTGTSYISTKWLWLLLIDILRIPCEFAFIQMHKHSTNDQLALCQVMVWCRQTTNHCLYCCWPRWIWWYDVAVTQWVKDTINSELHIEVQGDISDKQNVTGSQLPTDFLIICVAFIEVWDVCYEIPSLWCHFVVKL